ncbi:MAG: SET domain-containing protein-lysine N-methyltransferase [Chitinophagaceae bacterium]|nr:SET domain-containing protein-lysine N-methyltransferase [Chitinophagaceae bacterium]
MFRVIHELRIAKSGIQGKGAYATGNIPARKKIGDLGGVIISMREAKKRVRATKEIAMVELTDKTALDASVESNSLRYINHSCAPNSYIRVTTTRVEFYTLRAIKKGEELTADYGITHHEGKLPCKCGAPNCRGYI